MHKPLWRRLIDHQRAWSGRLDAVLPPKFTVDGNSRFLRELVWPYIGTGQTIYDVGSGSSPLVSLDTKRERRLRIVGLDIDPEELRKAPAGVYDEAVCADICSYVGRGDGDLVICQALLEHVPDTEGALRAISTILRPGARALLFVPSRNALFARLNLLLPEKVKRKVLFSVYPDTVAHQGFKAYYAHCTPRELRSLAVRQGFRVEHMELYYQSEYFRFCTPLHAAWRCWLLAFYALDPEQAAETFSIVLEKPAC